MSTQTMFEEGWSAGTKDLQTVEQIAVETVNRLTIVFDPVASLWRVTVGLYQAESQTLTLALHSVIKQRTQYLAKA